MLVCLKRCRLGNQLLLNVNDGVDIIFCAGGYGTVSFNEAQDRFDNGEKVLGYRVG